MSSSSDEFLTSDISDVERYIEGILLSLIDIVAVLGNASLWMVVLTTRSLRTESNYLLLCLSLADLLVSLVSMPVTVVTIFSSRWIFSRRTCQAMGFINMLTLVCSVMSLGLISINRYIKICRPHVYRRVYTNRNILLMTVGVWIFSALLASPPVIGWSSYDYLPRQSFCFCDWTTSVSYTFFMVGACFGGPLLMMSFSNFRILQTFRKSKKRVRPSNPPAPQSKPQRQQRQEEENKMQKPQTTGTVLTSSVNENKKGGVQFHENGHSASADDEPTENEKLSLKSNSKNMSEPKALNGVIMVAPADKCEDITQQANVQNVKKGQYLQSEVRNVKKGQYLQLEVPNVTEDSTTSPESVSIKTCLLDAKESLPENGQSLNVTKPSTESKRHLSTAVGKADDTSNNQEETERRRHFPHVLSVSSTPKSAANVTSILQVSENSQTIPSRISALVLPFCEDIIPNGSISSQTIVKGGIISSQSGVKSGSMSTQKGVKKSPKQSLTFILPAGSKAAFEEYSSDGSGNVVKSVTHTENNNEKFTGMNQSENVVTQTVISQLAILPSKTGNAGSKTENVSQNGNLSTVESTITHSQTSLVKAMREKKREKRRNEEFQLALSLMVVIVVFVICWFPFCITMFLSVFAPETLNRAADIFTLMLGYSNSCLNPIIYGLMNRNVQEAYRRMAKRMFSRCSCAGRSKGSAGVSVVDSPPSITTNTQH